MQFNSEHRPDTLPCDANFKSILMKQSLLDSRIRANTYMKGAPI